MRRRNPESVDSNYCCDYSVHLRIIYRVRHKALVELSSTLFYGGSLITRPNLPEISVDERLRDTCPPEHVTLRCT